MSSAGCQGAPQSMQLTAKITSAPGSSSAIRCASAVSISADNAVAGNGSPFSSQTPTRQRLTSESALAVAAVGPSSPPSSPPSANRSPIVGKRKATRWPCATVSCCAASVSGATLGHGGKTSARVSQVNSSIAPQLGQLPTTFMRGPKVRSRSSSSAASHWPMVAARNCAADHCGRAYPSNSNARAGADRPCPRSQSARMSAADGGRNVTVAVTAV